MSNIDHQKVTLGVKLLQEAVGKIKDASQTLMNEYQFDAVERAIKTTEETIRALMEVGFKPSKKEAP